MNDSSNRQHLLTSNFGMIREAASDIVKFTAGRVSQLVSGDSPLASVSMPVELMVVSLLMVTYLRSVATKLGPMAAVDLAAETLAMAVTPPGDTSKGTTPAPRTGINFDLPPINTTNTGKAIR